MCFAYNRLYIVLKSSISPNSCRVQDNFDISRLSILSRSPAARLLTDRTMTQRLIGIYPEVTMVPRAIFAVFDDNFERQRRGSSQRPLR